MPISLRRQRDLWYNVRFAEARSGSTRAVLVVRKQPAMGATPRGNRYTVRSPDTVGDLSLIDVGNELEDICESDESK